MWCLIKQSEVVEIINSHNQLSIGFKTMNYKFKLFLIYFNLNSCVSELSSWISHCLLGYLMFLKKRNKYQICLVYFHCLLITATCSSSYSLCSCIPRMTCISVYVIHLLYRSWKEVRGGQTNTWHEFGG